jgi:hypothetical protein
MVFGLGLRAQPGIEKPKLRAFYPVRLARADDRPGLQAWLPMGLSTGISSGPGSSARFEEKGRLPESWRAARDAVLHKKGTSRAQDWVQAEELEEKGRGRAPRADGLPQNDGSATPDKLWKQCLPPGTA